MAEPNAGQWSALMDFFCDGHMDLVRNQTDGAMSNVKLTNMWNEAALYVNKVPGARKTGKQWMEAWRGLKSRTKLRYVNKCGYQFGTGGGPPPDQMGLGLSEVQVRVLSLLSKISLNGDVNIPDPLRLQLAGHNNEGVVAPQQMHWQQQHQVPMQQHQVPMQQQHQALMQQQHQVPMQQQHQAPMQQQHQVPMQQQHQAPMQQQHQVPMQQHQAPMQQQHQVPIPQQHQVPMQQHQVPMQQQHQVPMQQHQVPMQQQHQVPMHQQHQVPMQQQHQAPMQQQHQVPIPQQHQVPMQQHQVPMQQQHQAPMQQQHQVPMQQHQVPMQPPPQLHVQQQRPIQQQQQLHPPLPHLVPLQQHMPLQQHLQIQQLPLPHQQLQLPQQDQQLQVQNEHVCAQRQPILEHFNVTPNSGRRVEKLRTPPSINNPGTRKRLFAENMSALQQMEGVTRQMESVDIDKGKPCPCNVTANLEPKIELLTAKLSQAVVAYENLNSNLEANKNEGVKIANTLEKVLATLQIFPKQVDAAGSKMDSLKLSIDELIATLSTLSAPVKESTALVMDVMKQNIEEIAYLKRAVENLSENVDVRSATESLLSLQQQD